MSFFKKDLAVVEENLPIPEPSEEHIPQHPMLQWDGPTAAPKRDHLEDYNEVQPFENAEGPIGWLRRKAGQAYAGAKAAKKAFSKGVSKEKGHQVKKKAAKAKVKAAKAQAKAVEAQVKADKAADSSDSDSDSE